MRGAAFDTWFGTLLNGTKVSAVTIPLATISSDVKAQRAFDALFLLSRNMDPKTFPLPNYVPCAFAEIMIKGCSSASGTKTCFKCGNKANWLPIPKGLVPLIKGAATASEGKRIKALPYRGGAWAGAEPTTGLPRLGCRLVPPRGAAR